MADRPLFRELAILKSCRESAASQHFQALKRVLVAGLITPHDACHGDISA
jgi:hypothetical protein